MKYSVLPVPVVVHWDGRFLCAQIEYLYFVNIYYILNSLLPKPKIRCIIEKQTFVRYLERSESMTDREKRLITLIRKSDDPSAAMEKVMNFLSSDQSPASEARPPAKQERLS